MKKIEITYYEGNDEQLKNNKEWINKQNVNLFIDDELVMTFSDSIYEAINFNTCFTYLGEKYPKAKLVKQGTYPTGWDYMVFELEG